MNSTNMGTAENQSPEAGFVTPPKHINFKAKKLFGEISGKIRDGAVAVVELNGGGPEEKHCHPHNHLFIVTSGEARVEYDDETVIIHENEAFMVEGIRPHAVWNNANRTTVMIGITIDRE
ncbi:cupin domain-containing protein [uncultured Ruminobacter sp.]|uniref:cupin domain-containing protein n=1 Tax=uncultured Ruminobacter sp. TaxID=538947 RepID=UPI0025F86956|nr:cupin domain-containing protein [uncultured Ruminobacter sp.]